MLNSSKKDTANFWITLIVFSLIGQVAWVVENMYFNVFIYKMFHANENQISLMVSLSAVSATVTTLLIGALSDKVGKRKMFICGGYILWGISILCFAFVRVDVISAIFPYATATTVGVTLVIILDCVMTFFGSTANDACFNAWLTDTTSPQNRGKVEGINAMMPLVSILVVFGGFMSFSLETSKDWTIIFSIIGGVVLLIGIMGIFTIQETPIKTDENTNYFANIIHGFKPSVIKNNPLLYFALVLFAVFGIAIQIFMPYLILYYEVSLGMENYVLIMAPAIILAAVFTALYGRVYDKKGFDIAIIPAVSLLALGFIVLAIFKGDALVFVGSLMMMCGYLSGMAVFGALIRDYTPENKAGMFQGLRIVAQVLIPGVIGPFIGSAVLKNADRITNNDGTTSFIPNANIFIAALVVTVILALLLVLVWYLKKKYFNKPKGENEGEVI